MILRKLDIENKSDLEFVEKLYIESFPQNERRPVSKMHLLIESNDLFNAYLLVDEDGTRIGFMTLWKFDSFIYLEHFAISPEFRNGGYGKDAVATLISATDLPLIGEIELPDTDELAGRRMKFYERQGFKVWDIPYIQPPYEVGYDSLPMKLITYRDLDLNARFEEVKTLIYSNVYQCVNV